MCLIIILVRIIIVSLFIVLIQFLGCIGERPDEDVVAEGAAELEEGLIFYIYYIGLHLILK